MKPAIDLATLCWPAVRLGEAIEELARRAHLQPASNEILGAAPAADGVHEDDPAGWIEWAARRLGIEAEAIATPATGLTELLCGAAPAVLRIEGQAMQGYLLLYRARGKNVQLLGPDLRLHWCHADALRAALCLPFERPFIGEVEHLMATAGVPPARWPQVRPLMMRERLASQQIGRCWVLRGSSGAGFWRQLLQARLPHRVLLMLAAFVIIYILEIAGWGLIGRTTLDGRLDLGWLTGWGLLVFTLIPLRLVAGWLDASFALDVGRLLKSRLLAGALRIDLEVVRRQGAGQLLGCVMESQALESLALNGGMGVLVALLELLLAASILAAGAGGQWHLLLLAAWLLLTIGLSWRYFQRLRDWTGMRVAMTHQLVERMVGHRTRLAQEPPLRRDALEDQALKEYLNTSQSMDMAIVPMAGLMPRGWMLIGLLGLAPAFVAGSATSSGLAIGLGGMLLANRALGGISGGLAALSRAGLAWQQVGTLFKAAGRPASGDPYLSAAQISGSAHGKTPASLVDAHGLQFKYRDDGGTILCGVDLTIRHGERILLEGASGGGKSTLASLLVGLRVPTSGLLLLNGLDRHTLGETWHQLATEAPQFHENHILAGTLGFNLLMGRNWPATEAELQEAKDLCIELGLGPLLERMPSGMMQMVGQTGWQLSHGERSRIFLARALLQNAQLTILDESFAALDPETLEKCLACALKRARTLLVIAHP